MPDYFCFLISILTQEMTIIECALRIPKSKITEDCAKYPLEPENRVILHSLLPEHAQDCGSIIDVKEIFEIEVID